jgi:hypothetical protein
MVYCRGQSFQLLHRMRAEKALGKPLPPKAIVHHADGSKRDDAPLVICPDDAYHMLLHRRMTILRAGGNPNTDLICSKCKLVKPHAAFNLNATVVTGHSRWCKPCYSGYHKDYLLRKKASHVSL